jgi:class 3 adenylate cyclase
MALSDDLNAEVAKIFGDRWTSRDGTTVPDPEDLKLSNDAVKLDGVVLYADLAESTSLVETETDEFAAEIYKTYLHCATKIIRRYEGEITSFDGDRVMAVFIGGSKNTNAVRSALAINHAVTQIINPAIGKQYPSKSYRVKHAVGIDSSPLFVARTGIRNNNDLVWVGRSANIAAKLCSQREGSYASWITKSVYDVMGKNVKFHDHTDMWEQVWWSEKSMYVYRSSYYWSVD